MKVLTKKRKLRKNGIKYGKRVFNNITSKIMIEKT